MTSRTQSGEVNLLRLPVLGKLLRWRYGRLFFQLILLLVMILLLIDGFTGPDIAPRNLAIVAPWVHYRGFIIIVLFFMGNYFCMACPFALPRTIARRLSGAGRRFPRALRNKWLAIGILFILFFAYEWLDLWSSPVLTAWVIIVYFVLAVTLELFFSESPFCKYVCPIGSFNFIYATLAPTQISIHDFDRCQTCAGKECVNGSYAVQPVTIVDLLDEDGHPIATHTHDRRGTLGCGTELYPPQIESNIDCLFCLDCVRACPHDNVALILRRPGRELIDPDAWRKRWDLSLLAILLAFMGLNNAFGMVPPVYVLMESTADLLGLTSFGLPAQVIEAIVLLILFALGNLLLPVLLILFTAWLTRLLTQTTHSLQTITATFARAFVPLGFGVWGAHYLFHFLISPLSIIPVLQEFFGQTGNWDLATVALNVEWIGWIQVAVMVGGFIWGLLIAQRQAAILFKRKGTLALIPWSLVLLGLMLAAIQIFSLPMEMRGSVFG